MANPHHIGKYLAEKALGAGSFATVWLAFDENLNDRVAIKVLADNWARNPDIRRRFIEEARLLRRIDHNRVVRVHDVDELPDGRPYFVMAVADRGTLHDKIEELPKGEPMETERALRLGLELCEALSIVHDFGVVHRDIKPSNILFRSVPNHEVVAAAREGRIISNEAALLGDFGLAKDLAVASGFTLAAGTPAYMAPEQASPTAIIDRRVDVFAATAVVYELLAGHPAFQSDTLSGVRRNRAESTVQPLHEVRPDLPRGLSDALDHGMARAPNDRLDSCFALSDELARFLPGTRIETVTSLPAPIMVTTSPVPPPPPGSVLPPPSTVNGPARLALTGAAGRVNDLITASKFLIDDAPVAVAATSRLVRPFSVAVVGPATQESLTIVSGMKRRDDMVVDHVTTVTHHLVSESDLVVLLFSATDADPLAKLNDLAAAVKAADVGPYAIESLVIGGDPPASQRLIDTVLAAPIGQTFFPSLEAATPDTVATLQHLASHLADARGVAFRATSGLRVLQTAMRKTPSSSGLFELLERIHALQDELPLLIELEMLREIVSGRTVLPRWLRSELARLLIHPEPARRLGLAPDADAVELQEAIQQTGTRWLVLENTRRIPFSSRPAMLVAQQALARLHAELAYYG